MAEYIVGRRPDTTRSHVVVSGDTTVSSNHCRISSLGDGVYKLDDNASTNGTFVKVQGGWSKVTSIRVRAGDQIRLGKYVTTISELLVNAVEIKGNSKLKFTRNPKTAAIEPK